MSDSFANRPDAVEAPARRAFAIVPHQTQPLSPLPKAILVGAAGNVVLRAVDSSIDVTITAVAGQILPVRAQFIRSTGTTATGLVGLA